MGLNMTSLQLLKIVYIDNADNYFLRYELGGDMDGNYSFALVFVPQVQTLNGLNYTNWLQFGEVNLNGYPKDRDGLLQACRDHRANWKV